MVETNKNVLCTAAAFPVLNRHLLLRTLICLLYFCPLIRLLSATNLPPTERITVEKVLDFRNPLPRNLTCIPNTNQLLVYHTSQKPNVVYQWDISRKLVLETYPLGDGFRCNKIFCSPDGRRTIVSCTRSSSFDVGHVFDDKALLIDNTSRKVIRSIPVEGAIYDLKSSTNFQLFQATTTLKKSYGFDALGESIPPYNFSYYEAPTNSRVRWVRNAKGLDPQTVGIFCRDDLGNEKHLIGESAHGPVVTKDNYVATERWGELIIWRLSDCQQVFKARLAKNTGFVTYCEPLNLILWADNDGSQLMGITIRRP